MQLSDQCRAVITNAQEVARGYKHDYVGTEHLLLALLKTPGVAAEVQLIRDELLRRISTSSAHTTGVSDSIEVAPSPRLRRLLRSASARALDDGRVEVEPADVLIALIRDETAGPVLAQLGVNEGTIRRAVAGRGAAGTSARAGDV